MVNTAVNGGECWSMKVRDTRSDGDLQASVGISGKSARPGLPGLPGRRGRSL